MLKFWRSCVRNDTKTFFFSVVWTFLEAINLSSLFLCTDEIIMLVTLIVCQNYLLTAFWCWWLFCDGSSHLFEKEEHRWVQLILYIWINLCDYVMSDLYGAVLSLYCQFRQKHFYLGFWWQQWKIFEIIYSKVHSKWCHCMSIIHILYLDGASRQNPWLLICCSNVTSHWPSGFATVWDSVSIVLSEEY